MKWLLQETSNALPPTDATVNKRYSRPQYGGCNHDWPDTEMEQAERAYLTDNNVFGSDIGQLGNNGSHKDVQVVRREWYYVGSFYPQHSLHCIGQLSTKRCSLLCIRIKARRG